MHANFVFFVATFTTRHVVATPSEVVRENTILYDTEIDKTAHTNEHARVHAVDFNEHARVHAVDFNEHARVHAVDFNEHARVHAMDFNEHARVHTVDFNFHNLL